MATGSLIWNTVTNMRCVCKASETPSWSLIRDQSSIVHTRVWGPMGAYGNLWGPLGACGDLCDPMGA